MAYPASESQETTAPTLSRSHALSYWLRPGNLTAPAADDVVLPLPRPMTPFHWLRRAALWLGVLLAVVVLARWDVALTRWRFMVLPAEPSGVLRQTLMSLRDFGQPLPMIVAMAVVYLTDRRRMFFIGTLLLALAVGALGCYATKWSLPRYRPYVVMDRVAESLPQPVRPDAPPADDERNATPQDRDPALVLSHLSSPDTWACRPNGSKSSGLDSFPSGHSYGAFAFAAVLAWFYPHLRWVFWSLAAGCAASRFIDAAHWASDCLAGAAIGYAAAWMALRPYAWVLPVIWARRRANRRRAAWRRSLKPLHEDQ